MAEIKMSRDKFYNYAERLNKNANDITRLLYEIRGINEQLKQGWTDNIYERIQHKLDNYDQMSIIEFIELCEKLSDYIKRVADTYECTENQLIEAIYGEFK